MLAQRGMVSFSLLVSFYSSLLPSLSPSPSPFLCSVFLAHSLSSFCIACLLSMCATFVFCHRWISPTRWSTRGGYQHLQHSICGDLLHHGIYRHLVLSGLLCLHILLQEQEVRIRKFAGTKKGDEVGIILPYCMHTLNLMKACRSKCCKLCTTIQIDFKVQVLNCLSTLRGCTLRSDS